MVWNDDVIVLGGSRQDMVELAGIWTLNNFRFMTFKHFKLTFYTI